MSEVTLPANPQFMIVPPQKQIREQIAKLETALLKLPQVETPITHRFSKGIYAREMFIPKGTLLIGKIHKFENLNIISQGDISVLTEEGVKRIKAPCTIVSPPGAKRVGYAHEDTTWTCIHATEETDLEKIEEEVIAKTFEDVQAIEAKDIEKLKEALCLGE